MTYVLRADEGKWIAEAIFTPEQDNAPSFWKEIRTSNPSDFIEVTQEERDERERQWEEAHLDPEPEIIEEQNTLS